MASAASSARVAPGARHFVLFDSLRGIAALSVLVFHAAATSNVNLFTRYGAYTSKLNFGVTLFFLISGFLLYRPHAVALMGGPTAPPTRHYVLRRAFRILPAYWVALTLLAIWPGLEGVFSREWWAYYGLLQSYGLAWSFRGLGVAWSLSVEIAFYAVLPLVAMGLRRSGRRLAPVRRLRLQLSVFAVLALASLGLRAAVHAMGWMDLYTSLPVNFFGFAVGMSLAAVSAWIDRREDAHWATRLVAAHPAWCWALAAAVFAAAARSGAFPIPFSGVEYSTAAYTAEVVVYSAIAFFVMLPAVHGEREGGLPRRVLGSRALSWIGEVSYGVFLWHLPLLNAFQRAWFSDLPPLHAFARLLLLCVPLALLLGWLSFRFVEKPALSAAHALGGRGTLGRPAGADRDEPRAA